MKCKKCNNEKIRILGKEYCPNCSNSNFNIKKHAGENYISEDSVRAILWGVGSSFFSTLITVFFFRVFLSAIDIPTFIIVLSGFLCFGSSGVLTVFFDKEYYVKDNFIISLLLAISVSIIDWYLGSESYVMTLFSSLLVFFVTISFSSLLYKVIIKKD